MGNIDFSADPKFALYTVFLLISGVILIALGPIGARTQKASARLITLLIGVAMLAYGVYLGWIFQGGTYELFWYVFVIPVVAVVRVVGALIAAKSAQNAPVMPPPQGQPMIPSDAPESPASGATDAPTPPSTN